MKRGYSDLIRFTILGLCALITAFLFPLFIPTQISRGIDDLPLWYTYSFFRETIKPFKIVGVVVDQHSISRMSHRWPWKRSVYSELVRRLDAEGANTIGIDLVFVGRSEDPDDDRTFAEAIRSLRSKLVLAYVYDPKRKEVVMPQPEFTEAAQAVGMLNTPTDSDGKIRRARSYITVDGAVYYSFPVMLAAKYLDQTPEKVIATLPLNPDRTFFINFMLNRNDIKRVSFYEVLNNLDALKQEHGADFLKNALVLVYSDTEIVPDTYPTPLGMMPGGLLHLNGTANILTGKFINVEPWLSIFFAAVSFVVLLLVLMYAGFVVGSVLTFGVVVFNFWSLVFLNMRGITFNFTFCLVFVSVYFLLGSASKSLLFFAQIYRIKERATIDPLRNLYTPRYFYHRLSLEIRKFYLRKDVFIVLLDLSLFKDVTDALSLDELKTIWQAISQALAQRGKLWTVYSADEIVGCVSISSAHAHGVMQSLKTSLESLLASKSLIIKVKVGCMRFRRQFPMRELMYCLSQELKKSPDDIVIFKEDIVSRLIGISAGKAPVSSGESLESFSEDIEDKNRELLRLVDGLKKEHNKTKESFFQIITSLVKALEARDPYTEGHSERVASYALMLGDKLGWEGEQREKLKMAALLHDLGKIGIPDAILHKKGRLDDVEYDFIKKHEVIAIRILEPLKEMREILPWILYHHERWDGKGYPHGLGGESIPEASQIISLADTFDTMTTGRDYKVAFPAAQALEEIAKNKDTQFNPRLVDSFVEVISHSSIHLP